MQITISIHALREEGDLPAPGCSSPERKDFYPRPPRGGRPEKDRDAANSGKISIHALREEGDHARNPEYPQDEEFLSTPSARRATFASDALAWQREISIHALREEGDASATKSSSTQS